MSEAHAPRGPIYRRTVEGTVEGTVAPLVGEWGVVVEEVVEKAEARPVVAVAVAVVAEEGPAPAKRGHRGVRCSAHSGRTGKPCMQPAMRGCVVCKVHGGSAPQVRAKGLARWSAALVPVAIRRTQEIMEDSNFPSTSFAASRFVLETEFGKAAETVSVAVTGEVSITAILQQRFAKRKALGEAGES